VNPELAFILLVYTQWIIWAVFYNANGQWTYHLDRLEPLFVPVSFGVGVVLAYLGTSYAAFQNHHFLIYIGLCLFAVQYFRASKNYRFKDSLALGFMLVFLNSFVWEFPIHFAEWVSLAWTPERTSRWIFQLIHLLPGLWLWARWNWTQPRAFYTARLGVAWFATSTAWVGWQYSYWNLGWVELVWIGAPLMVLCRFISLVMVLSIFHEGGHPTKDKWFPRH
jgi:hypothetical protein